jgi:mono/diheme cytochrome c family protein
MTVMKLVRLNLAVLVMAALLSGPALTADQGGQKTPADKGPGPALFRKHCARCHGPQGEGKDGPALRGLKHSMAEIAETVRIGVPGDMPAFRKLLTPKQVQAVSQHVYSLQGAPAKP